MKAGWVTKNLGQVTNKIGSGATPLGGEEAYKLTGISLIRSLNVYDDGFRKTKLARIDDEQADGLSNVVVEPNDVLLNITGASVARCCLAPADFLPARVNQHVSIIRPVKENLNSAFLHYLLISKTYKDRLLHTGEEGGSTRQAITKAQLQDFVIEYPESLPEQQRIVGLLDEAFAGLATAKANAEKNLLNARALFESHLQSVFTKRGKGWVEKPMGAVCDLQNGYAFKSNDYVETSNTLNIRMSSIRPGGNFDSEHNQRFLPDSYAKDYAAFLLKEGDLIIAMTDMAGDPKILGVPTLVSGLDGRNFLMNQRVGKLFGFSDDIRVPYLRYFLASPSIKQFYKSKGAGGLQVNISKGDVLSAVIPLPPLATQDGLVEQLDALSQETQRLATLYERKLAVLEALKKSLLHQAFSGEL